MKEIKLLTNSDNRETNFEFTSDYFEAIIQQICKDWRIPRSFYGNIDEK